MMASLGFGAALGLMTTVAIAAGPHEAPIQEFANQNVKAWLADPIIVETIKAQNVKHGSLQQAEIDALDKQWRAETGAGNRPMIDEMLANRLSAFLSQRKSEHSDVLTEARDLTQQTQRLNESMSRFLDQLRAA